MADTAIDLAAPLPFSNLDDLLAPLLLGTGARGSVALQTLLAIPSEGARHHLGSKEVDTPAGRLRLSLFDTNGARSISIGLTMRPGLGCIHGEVYAQQTLVPATLCTAAVGRPLSDLCETPESFPGRHAVIQRVRTLTSSTRILVAHSDTTCSLADFEDPARPRAPRQKGSVA